MVKCSLNDAEDDKILDSIASTYSAQSDRLEMGISKHGPRGNRFFTFAQAEPVPVLIISLKICIIFVKIQIGQPG